MCAAVGSGNARRKTVGVLVLGDVGRSPRMQYHALSLAAEESVGRVLLIGYSGARCVPPVEALVQSGKIELVLLREELLPRPRSKIGYLAYAPAKAALQLAQLLLALLVWTPRMDVLLLQTPPAIPALAAAWLARAVTGCTVVVDWHNLGFSVLQHGGLGPRHPFVLFSYGYEGLLGLFLDGHLCVTRAMAGWLRERWGLEARTLYDRPPAMFQPANLGRSHTLFRSLRHALRRPGGGYLWPGQEGGVDPGVGDGAGGEVGSQAGEAGLLRRGCSAPAPYANGEPGPLEKNDPGPWADGGTPWTIIDSSGIVRARPKAPRLLVSSTSWSADEDFAILLSALQALDHALGAAHTGGSYTEGGGSGAAGGGRDGGCKASDGVVGGGQAGVGHAAASDSGMAHLQREAIVLSKAAQPPRATTKPARATTKPPLATTKPPPPTAPVSPAATSPPPPTTALPNGFPPPQVVVIVTGKGPLREYYTQQMARLHLFHVAVLTLWLEPADYPSLLAAADLGVCLHSSTSGLDLPMKVLDMLGTGLPVCAVRFQCLPELLSHGQNGLLFSDAAELAVQLTQLLAPTREAGERLGELRRGVAASEAKRPRWEENWRQVAAPILLGGPAGPPPLTHRAFKLLLLAAAAPAILAGLAVLGAALAWMEGRGWLSFDFDETEVVVPAWVAMLW